MVVLGQNVGQPDDRELTITQTLAITMWHRECGIDKVGDTNLQEPVQNERDIIYPLGRGDRNNCFGGRILLVGSIDKTPARGRLFL